MKIFEHNNRKYLQLKDHSFEILNALDDGGYYASKPMFIQCTTSTSSGIVKEYLPADWDMTKGRYNGKMIFTLFKKNMFRYKSKAESLGKIIFLAQSFDGAKYLFYRWLLAERMELADSEANIELAKERLQGQCDSVKSMVNDQTIQGVIVNMNDYSVKRQIRWLKDDILKAM